MEYCENQYCQIDTLSLLLPSRSFNNLCSVFRCLWRRRSHNEWALKLFSITLRANYRPPVS